MGVSETFYFHILAQVPIGTIALDLHWLSSSTSGRAEPLLCEIRPTSVRQCSSDLALQRAYGSPYHLGAGPGELAIPLLTDENEKRKAGGRCRLQPNPLASLSSVWAALNDYSGRKVPTIALISACLLLT